MYQGQSSVALAVVIERTGTQKNSGHLLQDGATSGQQSNAPSASKSNNGLPQAGTLVVAPTSLLKQWQSEIKAKVCAGGSKPMRVTARKQIPSCC